MHLLKALSVFVVLLPGYCIAQNTKDDFSFFVDKIKTSYAGYPQKSSAGKFDAFVKQVTSEDKGDTFRMMARIANYFNDNHIQLFQMDAVVNRRNDTLEAKANLEKINGYLLQKHSSKKKFEGYWANDYNNSVFAIVEEKKDKSKYSVYLIETKSKILPPGSLIAQMEERGNSKFFTRYLVPGSGHSIYINPVFKNDSTLLWGEYSKFRKLSNYDYRNPYLASRTSWKPKNSGRLLNDDTYLLTIPDFAIRLGSIDSIIQADSAKIYGARNLILDLRDNRGGQANEYRPLTPLVYTKPIKNITADILCSDDLIDAYKDQLAQTLKSTPVDSAAVSELQKLVNGFEASKGRFKPDHEVSFYKQTEVLPFPKNVGIITNYACQSAAEMMLLDFRQSSKVKTFGETTFGAIDYLNGITLETPSGKYLFTIATARRNVAPGEKPLDGRGISPDIPISDGVPDWVQFVNNYYHEK